MLLRQIYEGLREFNMARTPCISSYQAQSPFKGFSFKSSSQKKEFKRLKMTFACYYNVRSVVEKLFIVTGAEIARQNSLNGLPTINLFLFKYSLCKYRVLKMAY